MVPAVETPASEAPFAGQTRSETAGPIEHRVIQPIGDLVTAAAPKPATAQAGNLPFAVPVEAIAVTETAEIPEFEAEVTEARATPKDGPVSKADAKPFASALLSQVKAVTAQEGRTVFNLQPRGLGSLEVEVISEMDVTSRVLIRVENPMVLQALRDDRQMLAQTIGVPDGAQIEFYDQSAQSERGNGEGQHGNSSGQDTFMSMDAEAAETPRNNTIKNGTLDILT